MSTILKNKIYLIALFFCIQLSGIAQFLDKKFYLLDSLNSKTINTNDKLAMDSLLKKYHSSSVADTQKVILLNLIVENIFDEKIWIRYNQLCLNKSIAGQKNATGIVFNTFKRTEALALNNIGYYHFNYASDFEKALYYYQKALDINSKIKNYQSMAISYSNIANVYQNKGDFLKALDIYRKAIDLDSVIVDKAYIMAPLNNMAQMYVYVCDTPKAILNLKKCLNICLKSNNKSMRSHLLHNIGILNFKQGDETGGMLSIKKALALRQEIGDKKGIVQSYISISGLYLINNNPTQCFYYLQKGSELLNELNNNTLLALYYHNLADYYSYINYTTKSIDALEKSIVINQNSGSFGVDLLSSVKSLIKIYGNEPQYQLKKLKLLELRYLLEEKNQKSEAQKITMKQNYDQSLKIQETEFKAQQVIKEEKNKSEKKRQRYITYGVSLILLLAIIFSFFLLKAFTRIKKNNLIISNQKIEVEKQKQIIEEKHKDITDSITYAHRIQSSLIPSLKKINQQYTKISVWFQPRDIVSGDFYWFSKQTYFNVFALADCTGHGVPGAFMSIIGLNQLDTLVNEKNMNEPASILNKLKEGVIASLNANTEHQDKRDGMDMALVFFNETKLHFAGANQSIYILRHNELHEYKGNKQPIGLSEKTELFTAQTIDLQKNDRIFMLSDGLADQFGGENGKKLKIKKLRDWFIETAHLSLHQQKQAIAEKINSFKANFEQTDDITLAIIEI
jgi:serine phosphatase RsbU (regulator of sigma subunit)/TPR repeat protein